MALYKRLWKQYIRRYINLPCSQWTTSFFVEVISYCHVTLFSSRHLHYLPSPQEQIGDLCQFLHDLHGPKDLLTLPLFPFLMMTLWREHLRSLPCHRALQRTLVHVGSPLEVLCQTPSGDLTSQYWLNSCFCPVISKNIGIVIKGYLQRYVLRRYY